MSLLRGLQRVERPRERLERLGPEALHDRELLALLLGTGCSGTGVMELADSVLAAFPAGPGSYAALKRLKGVGGSRAAALSAAAELGRRWAKAFDPRPVLDSPEKVVQHLPPAVRGSSRENFVGFYVNARSQLLHSETISVGTLSASLVHPREVFAPALSHSAAALIVVHNHPSGDTRPSAEDKEATHRLARAGELMGVPLLDHVIVAPWSFHSFKQAGGL